MRWRSAGGAGTRAVPSRACVVATMAPARAAGVSWPSGYGGPRTRGAVPARVVGFGVLGVGRCSVQPVVAGSLTSNRMTALWPIVNVRNRLALSAWTVVSPCRSRRNVELRSASATLSTRAPAVMGIGGSGSRPSARRGAGREDVVGGLPHAGAVAVDRVGGGVVGRGASDLLTEVGVEGADHLAVGANERVRLGGLGGHDASFHGAPVWAAGVALGGLVMRWAVAGPAEKGAGTVADLSHDQAAMRPYARRYAAGGRVRARRPRWTGLRRCSRGPVPGSMIVWGGRRRDRSGVPSADMLGSAAVRRVLVRTRLLVCHGCWSWDRCGHVLRAAAVVGRLWLPSWVTVRRARGPLECQLVQCWRVGMPSSTLSR